MFAKLYETKIGQILVKKDRDEEDDPEVRFYFNPVGLGVCSFALTFNNDDEGWDKQGDYFLDITEEKAFELVSSIISKIHS